MAKTKTLKPKISPLVEVEEVNSRRVIKLRSPSTRRVLIRIRPEESPPRRVSSAESTDSDDSRPPADAAAPTPSQPAVDAEFRNTERARAILGAMKTGRRTKKLDALGKTPPALHIVQTPPRKQKKVVHPPPVRSTPPRKAKRPAVNPYVEPPVSKNSVVNPPVKSKLVPAKKKSKCQATTDNQPTEIPPVVARPVDIPPIENHPQPVRSRLPTQIAPINNHPPQVRARTAEIPPSAAPEQPSFSNPVPQLSALSSPPQPQPARSNQNQAPPSRRSPSQVPVNGPPAPDFDPDNSMDIDQSAEHDAQANLEAIPSIRCKNSQNAQSGDEGGQKRRVRGVVNGTNLAQYKQAHNRGQPIKVEFLPDGTGPANQEVCSLIVHEIGSAVKDKVPMLAPSFRKLRDEDRQIVYDHLYPNFVVVPKDDQLWDFIFRRAIERYRDWKADCKVFYKENGPDVIPREFIDRPEQWGWLCSHFDDPKNQKLGETMSRVRTESERLDHRSGKIPFYMRAAQLKLQGERAPIVATYSKVYSHDPAGAALAAQMEERVRQALQDMDGDEDEDPEGTVIDARPPLPVDIQIKIINEVIGTKRGTCVSGAGRAFRKPPLPRGGSARTAELNDKLQKTQEEMLEMKAAFEERIRILEELAVRGGSANVNASEGATSLCGS